MNALRHVDEQRDTVTLGEPVSGGYRYWFSMVCLLCDHPRRVPTDDYAVDPFARKLIERISDWEVAQNSNFVRTAPEPAEFVKTAQHPVRAFAAVVAGSHFLLADHRLFGIEHGRLAPGWRDRHQIVYDQLEFPTENDLSGVLLAVVDVRQPDQVASRVGVNSQDSAYSRAGYANDHQRYNRPSCEALLRPMLE